MHHHPVYGHPCDTFECEKPPIGDLVLEGLISMHVGDGAVGGGGGGGCLWD